MRRNVCLICTLTKYKKRLQSMPVESFEIVNNKYIGTYDCYSTIEDSSNCMLCTDKKMSPAIILMHVARQKGMTVHAVTSLRKKMGVYVCDLLPTHSRETHEIHFCGKHNFFTGMVSSPLRILPCDYVKDCPTHPSSSS